MTERIVSCLQVLLWEICVGEVGDDSVLLCLSIWTWSSVLGAMPYICFDA